MNLVVQLTNVPCEEYTVMIYKENKQENSIIFYRIASLNFVSSVQILNEEQAQSTAYYSFRQEHIITLMSILKIDKDESFLLYSKLYSDMVNFEVIWTWIIFILLNFQKGLDHGTFISPYVCRISGKI